MPRTKRTAQRHSSEAPSAKDTLVQTQKELLESYQKENRSLKEQVERYKRTFAADQKLIKVLQSQNEELKLQLVEKTTELV